MQQPRTGGYIVGDTEEEGQDLLKNRALANA